MGALIDGVVNGASKEDLLSERYSPVGSGYWEEHPRVFLIPTGGSRTQVAITTLRC